jgi:hypothetical protein
VPNWFALAAEPSHVVELALVRQQVVHRAQQVRWTVMATKFARERRVDFGLEASVSGKLRRRELVQVFHRHAEAEAAHIRPNALPGSQCSCGAGYRPASSNQAKIAQVTVRLRLYHGHVSYFFQVDPDCPLLTRLKDICQWL